jgi:5'-3' exonuclease
MSKSFNETRSDKNNLLIIDGFNLAFRYKHANKRNFAVEYLATVSSFAHSYDAKQIVILSDGGSNYRKAIYPDYKAGRKLLRETQTEKEKEDFALFMEDWDVAFELCSTLGITIKYIGVEADDIAAYIATRQEILDNFNHVWLLSTDKDWDLLISDKVSRFSYRTRKETTLGNWSTQYPYAPDEHLSVKVLQGDKSDEIPGVAGIGEKRAATLVRQYGTAYDILSNLPIADSKVYIQNLNKFNKQIITNYELMDLESFCTDALEDNVSDLDNRIKEIINI